MIDFAHVGNVELIDWEVCNMCSEIMDVVTLVARFRYTGKFNFSVEYFNSISHIFNILIIGETISSCKNTFIFLT